jgi:ATP-dependent exoDNAse (exonuclease V) beta subunit
LSTPWTTSKKFDYITEVATDTLPTGRTYHTPDGSYPSITTILGKTANQAWLQAWKDRVGEEEAARVSKKATDRGTWVHEIAERHFNGEEVLSTLHNVPSDVRQMSRDLISIVSTGVEEIWGQEQVLWSNKLKYAGRTDMVGIWKGKPTIIDFKTSKKPKQSTQIKDYYLQGCAYAVAHNEMYGTGIKDIVIAICIDGKSPQLFEKSAVPFLPDLKYRRQQFDILQANSVTNT